MSVANTKTNYQVKVKKMVVMALFCAIAYVTMFVFRFKVSFLTFDAKDAVMTVAGLLFGPLPALVISFVVAFIEMITVSDTMWYGFIMNFASSAAFSCTAALIYKYKKNLAGAIVGLVSAVCAMTAVMMILNLIVTPFYMHAPVETVARLIPTLLLPFNLTKAVLNAALVLILYKPVSRALKAAKIIDNRAVGSEIAKGRENFGGSRWVSVILLAVGIVLVALSVIVFLVVLEGEFKII